jgi:hypothetical protein
MAGLPVRLLPLSFMTGGRFFVCLPSLIAAVFDLMGKRLPGLHFLETHQLNSLDVCPSSKQYHVVSLLLCPSSIQFPLLKFSLWIHACIL